MQTNPTLNIVDKLNCGYPLELCTQNATKEDKIYLKNNLKRVTSLNFRHFPLNLKEKQDYALKVIISCTNVSRISFANCNLTDEIAARILENIAWNGGGKSLTFIDLSGNNIKLTNENTQSILDPLKTTIEVFSEINEIPIQNISRLISFTFQNLIEVQF